MKCKACDAVLHDSELFLRTLPTGEQVEEDLCRRCRTAIAQTEYPSLLDDNADGASLSGLGEDDE